MRRNSDEGKYGNLTCKGICHRYKASKPNGTGRYTLGQKRCNSCGIFVGVDSTALLVTGAQMNAIWILPLIVAAAGIGIVVSRKF